MRKKSAADLDRLMWTQLEWDMGTLLAVLKGNSYELARKQLAGLTEQVGRNGVALGDGQALTEQPLPPTDERRVVWRKVGERLERLGALLEAEGCGPAEEQAQALFRDVRLHAQAALEAYEREQKSV